ncbi:MAG: DUF5711 family protein [Clostridiales bacterium]|nr:DUF5711 family protein [Clostridiales bacterium]
MSDKGTKNLRIVETNWDEIEQKIREHRLKRLKRIAIIVGICVAAIIIYYVYMQHRTYDDYTVIEEISRTDTSAAHYLSYGHGYLKYSNDGISYVTVDDDVLWNQSYGMENPMVSTCESYVAVADRQGETVFVLDESGLQTEISVSMPMSRVEIASQGTVAVLMEENETGYLALYSKSGDLLAEGAIYMENSGTPMDIALSTGGNNLAVSIVDVSSGTASTTVNFYNFGTSGKNQVDNLVASFTYEDTVIAKIVYVSDSKLIAFADNGVYTFNGSGSPAEGNSLSTEEEIQSIFYDTGYFGLVFSDTTKDAGRVIKIYNTDCKEQVSIETEFSYDSICFLDNHEICLLSSTECSLFILGGLQKFTCEFEEEVSGFFHAGGFRNYVVLKENTTERIRLNLFSDVTEEEEK